MNDASRAVSDGGQRSLVPAMMRRIALFDDRRYLASLLAYHGAPTLQGVKPAVLVRPAFASRDLQSALPFAVSFIKRHFRVETACLAAGKSDPLLLLYEPRLVAHCLSAPEAASLLEKLEYRHVRPVALLAVIAQLSRRCAGSRFPHEVGLLLGYPPPDVRDFMCGTTRPSRRCGCWQTGGCADMSVNCQNRYRAAKLRVAQVLVESGLEADRLRKVLSEGGAAA